MVDASALLWGLMWPDTSRAQVLFGLREKFPQYRRRSQNSLLYATSKGQDLRLTDEVKRILARAAMEADAMVTPGWIPTICCSGPSANLIARLPSN